MNGFSNESGTMDRQHNCPQQHNNDYTNPTPDKADAFYLGALGTHYPTNHFGRDTSRGKRCMADVTHLLWTMCICSQIGQ